MGARQLPSPPRREWLELVTLLARPAASDPVWFLADPRRADLALVDPAGPPRHAHDFSVGRAEPVDCSGACDRRRRGAACACRAPGWFAAEGWSLTPETAGMARLMGRGPHLGPITAYVRRRQRGGHSAVIGGRNLGAAGEPRPRGSRSRSTGATWCRGRWLLTPGFFLRTVPVPAGALAGDGRVGRRSAVRSAAVSRARPWWLTAVEQFDRAVSRACTMWGVRRGLPRTRTRQRDGPSRGAG